MSGEKPNRQSILNYTTSISTERTVGEITRLLVQAKATAILTEFEGGIISALSFRIGTEFGVLTFRLPARVEQVYKVLARSPKVPPRLRTRDQAARVAWRIIKDWLEAQLAMIQAGLVDLEQVFLPYVFDAWPTDHRDAQEHLDRLQKNRAKGKLRPQVGGSNL